jgi:hypothetical protein
MVVSLNRYAVMSSFEPLTERDAVPAPGQFSLLKSRGKNSIVFSPSDGKNRLKPELPTATDLLTATF